MVNSDYIKELRTGKKKELPKEAPKEPTKIIIVRHGSTKLNASPNDDKIRGWADVPLDDVGKSEALKTAHKLKKAKVDGIVASDLSRTQETAQIISKETGFPILEVSDEFRPWNVGILTGHLTKEVLPIMEKMVRTAPSIPIEDGESFYAFKERFLTGVDRIRKQYAGKTIILVTHSRGDRILAASEDTEGGLNNHDTNSYDFTQKGISPGDFREIGIGGFDSPKEPEEPVSEQGLLGKLVSDFKPKKGIDYFGQDDVDEWLPKITPQKGIHYVDGINGKDGKDGRDGVDGKNGIDGENGKDGADGEDGINGQDGENGEDGRDAEITGEQIVGLINKLIARPEFQIDFSHVKGIPTRFGKMIKGGGLTAYVKDLSSSLNGSTTVFTLPNNQGVVQVLSSSAPFVFRPTVDYTVSGLENVTITFAAGIDASTMLAAGQTLTVLYKN